MLIKYHKEVYIIDNVWLGQIWKNRTCAKKKTLLDI